MLHSAFSMDPLLSFGSLPVGGQERSAMDSIDLFDDLLNCDDDFISFLDREFVLPAKEDQAEVHVVVGDEARASQLSTEEHTPAGSHVDVSAVESGHSGHPMSWSSSAECAPRGLASSLLPRGDLLQLAIQRCAGPPTSCVKKPALCPGARLVVTSAPVPMAQRLPKTLEHLKAQSTSVCMVDSDGEDSDVSNDTDEYGVNASSLSGGAGRNGQKPNNNKRKAPDVDWRSISDPSERRRQRRLAKNRVTAARSRDRKKVQWFEMESKLAGLQNDNRYLQAMLEQLSTENQALRAQVASLTGGDAAALHQGGSNPSSETAVLVSISIMLLVVCFLPGDRAAGVLGSALPLLLLSLLSRSPAGSQSLSENLVAFLAMMTQLLSRSSRKLRRSVHRMLFKRHLHMGRSTMLQVASWAAQTQSPLMRACAPSLGALPLLSAVKQDDAVCTGIKEEPVFCCSRDLLNPLLPVLRAAVG